MSQQKPPLGTRLVKTLKAVGRFLLNPRFMLCFGIAWMITNGWSYVAFVLGNAFDVGWLKYIATAYMALLWLPFTPEKIITFAIAILLLKLLFPNDKKTLAVLHNMKLRAKDSFEQYMQKRRARRIALGKKVRVRKPPRPVKERTAPSSVPPRKNA